MKSIRIEDYNVYCSSIDDVTIEANQKVINTINAHSYIVAKKDSIFKKSLIESDILLPDGEGIVLMAKKLKSQKINKIAGADIHAHLLSLANKNSLRCFYLGSSQKTLNLINEKLSKQYPNVAFGFYSPPFKAAFSEEDNREMISEVNIFNPNILFVGMTAPKQEKWVNENKNKINAQIICSIGAVFDFVAGTKKRAPQWIIALKLEWFYRSLTAFRLTKRYLYSTPLFLLEIIKLKHFSRKGSNVRA